MGSSIEPASPLSRPSAGQVAAAAVFAIGAAVPCLWLAAWQAPSNPPLAVVCVAGALFCFLGLTAGIRRRRLPAGVPQPRLDRLGEEPALFLPRWSFSPVMGVAALAVLGAAAVASALSVGFGRLWVLAVPLVLLGLYFLLPGLFMALGVWRVGGIWLTPTGVVCRAMGVQSSARWEDITEVQRFTQPPVVRVRTARQRRFPPWPGKHMAPRGQLTLRYEDLAVSATTVINAISSLAQDPGARQVIATPEGLDRLQAERRSREETSWIPGPGPRSEGERRAEARRRAVVSVIIAVGIALAAIVRHRHGG